MKNKKILGGKEMFKWTKFGTIILAVAMLVSMLTVPVMAEGTVVFSEGFENVVTDEASNTAGIWSGETGVSFRSDENNTALGDVSITSGADDVHGGKYALKMRTNSGGSQNVYAPKYHQTPGAIYKISGWVKMVNPNNTASVLGFITAAENPGYSADEFYTKGEAFNPYVEGINQDGYYLTGVYNEWVQFTRYFSPKNDYFYVVIGANVKNDTSAYILWDDIEVTKIDNVIFENSDGSAIEKIAGGTSFTGSLLMSNVGVSAQQYIGMKALYERKENNCLQLLDFNVFPINVPVGIGSNTGKFRENLTFDMTEYEEGKDYVAKVFVWDSASGMHTVVYGAQD